MEYLSIYAIRKMPKQFYFGRQARKSNCWIHNENMNWTPFFLQLTLHLYCVYCDEIAPFSFWHLNSVCCVCLCFVANCMLYHLECVQCHMRIQMGFLFARFFELHFVFQCIGTYVNVYFIQKFEMNNLNVLDLFF